MVWQNSGSYKVATTKMSCGFEHRFISELSADSKYVLACLLNPIKVISADGMPRDWRGLAELVMITQEELNGIIDHYDKTTKILELWVEKTKDSAIISMLFEHLKRLDRYDVYDDLFEMARRGLLVVRAPGEKIIPIKRTKEEMMLTFEDKQGPLLTYNAFVLYAKQDKKFVNELLLRMKGEGYRLCTKSDLLPGFTTQYVPVSKLIMERCHHIITIYSEHFFSDNANRFFVDYAQAASIENNGETCTGPQPKLIPCVLGNSCNLPENVRFYFSLYYVTEGRQVYDFWQKLIFTLSSGPKPQIRSTGDELRITEILLNRSENFVKNRLMVPLPGNMSVKSQTDILSATIEQWTTKKIKNAKKPRTEIFSGPYEPKRSTSMFMLNKVTNCEMQKEKSPSVDNLDILENGRKSPFKRLINFIKRRNCKKNF